MKKFIGIDVYEAANKRIEFIFKNFERIYLSFSGGKDSGVMLNLVLDYMREHNIKQKIGLMVMDNEANYSYSLEYMKRTIDKNLDLLDVYWICLPLQLPCTVSQYDTTYITWDRSCEEKWIHPMPNEDYVVNIDNHDFPFYYEGMHDKEFYDEFGEWYSKGKTSACLIGIRTHESLNRWRAIMNSSKETMKGEMWTKKNTEHLYNCYPIYDWRTEDVWIANAKFDWDYNKLYDIFYKAGLTVHQMRVASPFMSESKSSLNMYRVIDSHVWVRLVSRISGTNFIATYGKQLNYRKVKLPKGHTWKSFVKFLLDTLPEETSKNFKMRFAQSIKFWARVGRGLPDTIINQLDENGVSYEINGKTPHGSKELRRVIIWPIPDHVDFIKAHPSMVASWKRFALTILKNDHTCKYLGLQPTKEQQERQKYIQNKYKNI